MYKSQYADEININICLEDKDKLERRFFIRL